MTDVTFQIPAPILGPLEVQNGAILATFSPHRADFLSTACRAQDLYEKCTILDPMSSVLFSGVSFVFGFCAVVVANQQNLKKHENSLAGPAF